MLAVAELGLDPMVGFLPNLRQGVDYRITSGGVAIGLNPTVASMFREIQTLTNQAANLFGMPGSITIDGKIGAVTGQAVKFTVGKLSDDLRGNLSPEARDGQPAGIAKDARNVIGTLKEAIALKGSAPIVGTPVAPTPRFQLPTVKMQRASLATLVKTAPLPTTAPLAPLVQVAPAPTAQLVTTALPERRKMSTPVFLGVLGLFLAAGLGAAVLVGRRS
jgi:hypothetical protein